jgi:hypothetical protein
VAPTKKTDVNLDRRVPADRREAEDRRKTSTLIAEERRQAPRRKTPRRRQIDPTTCERDYSDQEIEFMQAMDAYKRSSGRMFPTCSEILEVLRDLGYQQAGNPTEAPATVTVVTDDAPDLQSDLNDSEVI